jgi:DNA polymerase-3 subunit alpha (Gram-positive type)
MGGIAAESIYNSVRCEDEIKSVDDLKKRAKIGNASIELLKKFGCLNGLPESDQLSFFDVI